MKRTSLAGAAVLVIGCAACANQIDIVGGATELTLDVGVLAHEAGLEHAAYSEEVVLADDGSGGASFPIRSRDTSVNAPATTLTYECGGFEETVVGEIAHGGSVAFNEGSVALEGLLIAFDAQRVGRLDGLASGFYVESAGGVSCIAFDISIPERMIGAGNRMELRGDLLISEEFARHLRDRSLAGLNVGGVAVNGRAGCTGVDVTDSGPVFFIDLRMFFRQYVRGETVADYTGDGAISPDDFGAYYADWLACREIPLKR